jgi:hypothetical protein
MASTSPHPRQGTLDPSGRSVRQAGSLAAGLGVDATAFFLFFFFFFVVVVPSSILAFFSSLVIGFCLRCHFRFFDPTVVASVLSHLFFALSCGLVASAFLYVLLRSSFLSTTVCVLVSNPIRS